MLQQFTLSNGNTIAINIQYIVAVYGDRDDPQYTYITLTTGDSYQVEGSLSTTLHKLIGEAYPVDVLVS